MFAFTIKQIAISFGKQQKGLQLFENRNDEMKIFIKFCCIRVLLKLVKQTPFQNETNRASKLLPGNHDWWKKTTKML